MRLSMYLLLAFAVVFGAWSTASVAAQGSTGSQAVATASSAPGQPIAQVAQGQPSGKLDVDISVNKGGGGGARWYANPVWIAIGGLGLIVLVLLIVMAVRGGGTTVVKG
jgi:hypothetical protein